MNPSYPVCVALAAAALLCACGGHDHDQSATGSSSSSSSSSGGSSSGTSNVRGTLLQSQQLPTLSATTLAADLTSAANTEASGPTVLSDVLSLAGAPKCDVSIYHIEYNTVGGQGEATTASGALMIPSGGDSSCSGARPIVLYAHGTNTVKTFNIADLSDSSNAEGLLIAAFFAARGYIVVAPNYAGYDTSTLAYHPFLVAEQQSDDMIDALAASHTAISNVASTSMTSDNGQLFITGYSQGGYVAMATHRALEAAGSTVTASVPMSGPYALSAYVDAQFYGQVGEGATIEATLLYDGYQNSYGNVAANVGDVINTPYDTADFATLLPSSSSRSALYNAGALPADALFDAAPPSAAFAMLTPPTATLPAAFASLYTQIAPVYAQGFGAGNLIINSYRLAWLQDESASPDGGFPAVTTGLPATAPQVSWRQDLKANDLRNWTPKAPTLLCGGEDDPEVYFFNTTLMQNYWTANPPTTPSAVNYLDVDPGTGATAATGAYGTVQSEFQALKTAYAAANGAAAVNDVYHSTLVPPFCLTAAINFFDGFPAP